ncbi:MAG: hypothetical protein K2J40_07100, partial [Ruminococcus sp.]|nr:hypothetical protein [Ruminococcus sp.]
MKKSSRITSLIMSAMMSISAIPVASNAVDTEDTENPNIIYFDTLPCYIDGKTVVFMGGKDYDFVTVTAPDAYFETERNENTFSFTPEQDGKYVVSMIWLEETPI